MPVKPIPDGYEAAIPYLSVSDAAAAIEFYKRVFGATELSRMTGPDGRVEHAEMKIGNAMLMLADEHPEIDFRSPKSLAIKRSPVAIHLYVADVDDVYKRGIAAGAVSIREPADQFYGDRNAQLQDPSGHLWYVSTRKEEVSPETMKARMDALSKQGA
jgi:PhnB protein